MNRMLFAVAALFGASGLVLLDSTVKGTALMVLAAAAAMVLRRDSAATRHLVWLLAIVAMLAVPVLSSMLPQWRVLPRWTEIGQETAVADTRPPSIAAPIEEPAEMPWNAAPAEIQRPFATATQPTAELPETQTAATAPQVIAESWISHGNWSGALPVAWAAGFFVLVLRLLAARWMLWNTERQATVLCSARQPAKESHDTIITALETACAQLGIGRSVTLLIHPERTIPAVWGIFRHRLLLPAAARHWSGEQLRSVLLHELAHVKRRDMIGQLLAQIACALHWFNPLAWFAAWRLGVERERACDDLVLVGGVRPSVYAEHLLDVATRLAPARWTRACSLVMARKPSLEGRLVAVLSGNVSRRKVSLVLAAIALAVTVAIAVPIAMLRAADEKPSEKPEPTTADMKPKGGEKLDPETEKRLRWGEPAAGLRAAIAVRPAPAKPKVSDFPNELYLAVQNVSTAPIRLSDSTAAPELRVLYLKIDGRTLSSIVSKDPTGTDVVLQPREAVFLLMFAVGGESKDRPTSGSIEAEDLLKEPNRMLYAEMHIANAPPGAWTGKLVTGETGGEAAACKPQPKGKFGQALFNKWQANARVDGKIPGALIGRLGMRVKYFISLNKDQRGGRAFAQKFEKLLPHFDAARDWTPSDAIALIDDVSAIEEIPLLNALEDVERNMIRGGEPLPAELADAPWGSPADAAYKPFASPCNLRVAWLLEPRAKEYPLGTPLKSRILVHNAGKETVIFVMPSWQQSPGHTARDASGAAIKVSGVSWTTMAQKTVHRLAPGEYCETPAAGVGVGAKAEGEDWANARVGSWIHAKVGDEVRFAPAAVEVRCSPSVIGTEMMDGRPLNVEPKDSTDLRQRIIAERVDRELPLPSAAAERTQIIRRVTSDLFGEPPTPEEIAAFVADKSPTARDALVQRLVGRRGVTTLMGAVPSGETLFRVLPVDLDAAKRPRVATGPGWFILGDNQILQVNANKATILFFAPGPKAKAPGKPGEISLPDGRGTYAIAWERGAGVLWIKQKGLVRSYDFTDPAQVKETAFRDPADLAKVPKLILDALPPVLDLPREPPASVSPSVQPDAVGAAAAPDKQASEVLENLKKCDAIYESGFSASGTEMGRDLLDLRSGASLDVTRRWKLTCDDNRFGYTADVTDHEKTPGRKNIRTKTWGYWGQDLSGYYFEDTLFDANPEGKETQRGKWLHTSLWGPRDASINLSKYVFLYGLGRFFSKDLVKITRVEKRNDGLLVVSALGTASRITIGGPFSSGRWELEIEPAAAWIVRKARFDSDAQPQSTWAGLTEMTNSGTVWSGPYCIPKEAVINCQGPVTKKIETKRLTFDPVVGKFDEKLYSAVRQAVGYNKEPTLKVFDNRVSPETVTEPNRPKPERTQH